MKKGWCLSILVLALLGLGMLDWHSVAYADATSDSQQFRQVWQKLSQLAEEAAPQAVEATRYDKNLFQKLSGSDTGFGTLMRRAVEMLANTEGTEYVDKIYGAQADISKWRRQIAAYKKERIGAPEESRNPLIDTRERLDKKIHDREEKIADATGHVDILKAKLLLVMRQSGISISAEQLDYLIIAAEGEDVLDIMAATENLKKIQQTIEQEIRRDSSSGELIKAYTGMYLVTLEAYAYAHTIALENITEKYMGRVDKIIAEARANKAETQALTRDASDADRANLKSNLLISTRTIEVGQMYQRILTRRIENLKRSRAAVEKKLGVARNTYKTVITGSRLIELVKTGGGEYSAVLEFKMPELKNIYESALLDEFKVIAAQVKEE